MKARLCVELAVIHRVMNQRVHSLRAVAGDLWLDIETQINK